jgi:hypothetical protein
VSDELQIMYDRGWKSFHEWAADSSNKIVSDEGVGREFGDKLRELAADKVGTAAMKGAFWQGWRANRPYRNSLESQVEELTRDLAAAREELEKAMKTIRIMELSTPIYEDLDDRADDLLARMHQPQGWSVPEVARLITDMRKRIATDWEKVGQNSTLLWQLAAANATVEKCKAAGFIREDGTVRCQRTADGVELKPGDFIYADDGDGHIQELVLRVEFYGRTTSSLPSNRYYLDDCYSTRTAAEAARDGKENR